MLSSGYGGGIGKQSPGYRAVTWFLCDTSFGTYLTPSHSLPLPPWFSHLPCVFQVIIIQPQVKTQPESSAEPEPPTEELSQEAQATKEDQPPSKENPEVV